MGKEKITKKHLNNHNITHKDIVEDDTNRVEGASEEVNHPSHYQHIMIGHGVQKKEKFEVIDIIQGIVYSLGLPSDESGYLWQTQKYIMRCPFKEAKLKDLEKADWYLQRLIELVKSKENQHEL